MRNNQRGVALIAVLLVLLVLTILGITASVMMTQEDRTSSRQDQQRQAFYVAEAGLRDGERILRTVTVADLPQLLGHTTTTANPAVSEPVPTPPGPWDVHHLGTYLTTAPGGGTEVAKQQVTLTGAGPAQAQAFYALYVRSPQDGSTTRIRLISAGWIEQNGNPLATKILEEEIDFSGVAQAPTLQKQTNAGGTGSGQFGG